jgi:hypothetical protein
MTWVKLATIVALLTLPMSLMARTATGRGPAFRISFPASVHAQPITGRLYLMISRTNEPEVRLQSTWVNSPEMIGVDVTRLTPGQVAVVNGAALGTPLRSLSEVAPGDYYVQAVLNVYTDFHRADGHVIWTHVDQGEGQQFNRSPGNLHSKVYKLHLEPSRHESLEVRLTEVIPPIPVPPDTEWVKHIRIQSKLLTHFWGRPIYLGAVVLLPRDYAADAEAQYPVIYYQPEHFRSFPPFEFRTDNPSEKEADRRERNLAGIETGYEFYQAWSSDHFPRMVAVSIQTPTPFSDWSGGVDSANNGPYGRAIVTELIPFIEEQFRIIREPYARVLTGKHSAGRAALALHLMHPEFFGGAWIFHPWAFDLKSYFGLNIYENDNAFTVKPTDLPSWGRNLSGWLPLVERPLTRTTSGIPFVTFRQASQHDAVMGSKGPGGEFDSDDATLGPVGKDGYPQPLWDRMTGQIDHEVADYWREHGDLAHYAEKNWPTIGPMLLGKLHFYVGDMDEFYRNYGVHLFEDFLKRTVIPHYEGSFSYGTLNGGWQPMSNAELVRIMADHIIKNAPKGSSLVWREE